MEESAREYGLSSTSDFQHLKMSSPKSAYKKYRIKEKSIKEIDNPNLNLDENSNNKKTGTER